MLDVKVLEIGKRRKLRIEARVEIDMDDADAVARYARAMSDLDTAPFSRGQRRRASEANYRQVNEAMQVEGVSRARDRLAACGARAGDCGGDDVIARAGWHQ